MTVKVLADTIREAVLDYVEARGGGAVSAADIAETLGLDMETTGKILDALVEEDVVARVEGGYSTHATRIGTAIQDLIRKGCLREFKDPERGVMLQLTPLDVRVRAFCADPAVDAAKMDIVDGKIYYDGRLVEEEQ